MCDSLDVRCRRDRCAALAGGDARAGELAHCASATACIDGPSTTTPAVTAFHIHIARMDVVPDADGALLDALQAGLQLSMAYAR